MEGKEKKPMSATDILEDLMNEQNASVDSSSEETTMEINVDEPTAEIPAEPSSNDDEEDVKIFSSKPGRKKKKEHSAFQREDDTASIDLKPGKSVKSSIGHPLTEEEEESDNGQLSFDDWEQQQKEYTDGLDAETSPEGDVEIVNQFRQNRENKVRSFKLNNDALKEETDSEEEPIEEFEEEYIEDFSNPEDAEAVSSELKYRLGKTTIGFGVSAIMEFLLIAAAFCVSFEIFSDMLIYTIGSLLLLGILIFFNMDMMRDGLEDIKDHAFSVESAVMITSVFSVVHTLLQFVHLESVSFGGLPALAGFSILCTANARRLKIQRINQNFDFITSGKELHAAKFIDNEKTALEIGGSSVATGIPRVAFFRPVSFLYKFLTVSYERRPELKKMKLYIPFLWVASLIIAAFYGLIFALNGSGDAWWNAIELFGIAFCVAVPASIPLSINGSLLRSSKASLKAGGLLTGRNAVDRFGKLNAVVVDAAELFPEDNILLHGIKTFEGFRIDQAILDAASLMIAAEGPLASMFMHIIENKTEILQEVDSLTFEQSMGVSGWVQGRRIFLGNATLMKNHGIGVPSADYEARYKKNGRELVYLSVSGKLSAMFVVSYTADPVVGKALQKLTREGITLLIHTCDSNITEERIADLFDINPYYVDVLGSVTRISLGHLVQEQIEEDTVHETVAEVACENSIMAKAVPLSLCNRLRFVLPLTALVSLGLSALGVLLVSIFFFALNSTPSILYILIYSILSMIVTYIVPHIRKI